ncbi:MAG: class I SAM-dependent methyltransferase [Gammaproteobacteria bacterium]|jgi:SAM-dependent methyltransferase|nr:class I SAM-dependent methyltransferase [Gammaproteobacteria bacterium]
MKNKCPVCDSKGFVIHQDVLDYYFNHEGRWSFLKCKSEDCGAIWVDPLPKPEELSSYYENYYTHQSEGLKGKLKSIVIPMIARGLIDPAMSRNWRQLLVFAARKIYPSLISDAYYGLGGAIPFRHKRVLDVGCGNGDRLPLFERIGWEFVAGIDLDDKAVDAARLAGLNVQKGSMDSIPYEDNSFEFLFSHHVVEHVYDIADSLSECFRVLEPGGVICILTPNGESRLHQYYGKYWRGLEAPRHLQIYTIRSLEKAALKAGFIINQLETTDRSHDWMRAQCEDFLQRHGIPSPDSMISNLDLQSGEELFLLATKP